MVFGISLGSSSKKDRSDSQYTTESQSQDQSTSGSTSSSFGNNQSTSFGNNQSTSFGNNQSTSFGQNQSTSGSYIDPTQGGFLNSLWNSASEYANPGNTDARAQEILGQVMPGMQSTFASLQGMTDPSAMITQQANALSTGLGNLFRNEINPAIVGGAIASGGFGGGRQGVAQGVASGQIADSFTSGLADITSAANNQAMSAANAMSSLGSDMFNLGTATPGMDVLTQLSGILGGPTVLQNSQSSGTTGSQATGTTGSQATGTTGSQATGTTGSQSNATSQSSGSSSAYGQGTQSSRGNSSQWNLGF